MLQENEEDFNHPIVLSFTLNQIFDLSNPAVRKEVQIADVMRTMDNRIKVDEDTLKQFESDANSAKAIQKYQFKKLEIEKRRAARS